MRLLILTFVTLFIAIIVSFGIMGLLASTGLQVSSATPPVMMSMLLAVSIDYALFLLARFKEEVQNSMARKSMQEQDDGLNDEELDYAVHQMLKYSGHTICGSQEIRGKQNMGLLIPKMIPTSAAP